MVTFWAVCRLCLDSQKNKIQTNLQSIEDAHDGVSKTFLSKKSLVQKNFGCHHVSYHAHHYVHLRASHLIQLNVQDQVSHLHGTLLPAPNIICAYFEKWWSGYQEQRQTGTRYPTR